MNFKKAYISLFFVLFSAQLIARANENIGSSLSAFNTKIAALYSKFAALGFVTYKASYLDMHRNTEFPIFVELKAGSWYQFIIVGDPEAKKIEVKLGIEGIGDFITDKFKPQDTEEYYTQFSFICPRNGRYLLTLFQKGSTEKMLAHIAIMQRNNNTSAGTYSFK